jgi:hypothetical protein
MRLTSTSMFNRPPPWGWIWLTAAWTWPHLFALDSPEQKKKEQVLARIRFTQLLQQQTIIEWGGEEGACKKMARRRGGVCWWSSQEQAVALAIADAARVRGHGPTRPQPELQLPHRACRDHPRRRRPPPRVQLARESPPQAPQCRSSSGAPRSSTSLAPRQAPADSSTKKES